MSDGAVEFLVTFADLVRTHGPGGGDPSASRRVEAASDDGTRDGAVRVLQILPLMGHYGVPEAGFGMCIKKDLFYAHCGCEDFDRMRTK